MQKGKGRRVIFIVKNRIKMGREEEMEGKGKGECVDMNRWFEIDINCDKGRNEDGKRENGKREERKGKR